MRPAQIINHHLGIVYGHPQGQATVDALRRQGWRLVRVEYEVSRGLSPAWGDRETERMRVDIEGDRIYTAERTIHRQMLERAADTRDLIAHVRNDMVTELALGIAERVLECAS